MADLCTVIVGTYEKLILGYEIRITDEKEANFHLVFTNNEHLAPVKCLAVSTGRGILASSGADESIRLLDLKKKVELGQLPYHKGTVNDLHFYKNSHLFSCSDDGKMVVWRRRDWNMVKAFRRHRGEAVKAVSVHPTGCLALSVGNDKTLRTWDLVAGKNAFSINLKKRLSNFQFCVSPTNTLIFLNHKQRLKVSCGHVMAVFSLLSLIFGSMYTPQLLVEFVVICPIQTLCLRKFSPPIRRFQLHASFPYVYFFNTIFSSSFIYIHSFYHHRMMLLYMELNLAVYAVSRYRKKILN